MKRALLVLFGIVLLIGMAAAWWLVRDTPARLLRDGLRTLMEARSASLMRLDVFWTDPVKRVTVGWSAVGHIDLRDLTAPEFFGILNLSEGVVDGEQVAELVVNDAIVALRPRVASESFLTLYERAIADPERKTFAAFERNRLLKALKLSHLVATGTSAEVRETLPALVSVVRPASRVQKGGVVPFTLDEAALRPFLISLTRVWSGRPPSAPELQNLERVSRELALGSYELVIDRRSGRPYLLMAEWPLLDEAGKERLRMGLRLDLRGLNVKTDIAMPDRLTDATQAILGVKSTAGLVSAPARPDVVVPTGTVATPPQEFGESEEGRFDRYFEDIQRRRRGY